MPGPNSAPNGDTTIVQGHRNETEIFVPCSEDKATDYFDGRWGTWVPKRVYLAERGRLETGKTQATRGR